MDSVDSISPLPYNTIILEKLRYCVRSMIETGDIHNHLGLAFHIGFDEVIRQTALQLDAYIWAHPDEREVETKYPKDAWNYIKFIYYPRLPGRIRWWLEKRYPVKYIFYKTNCRAVFRDLEYLSKTPRMTFAVLNDGWKSWE